MPMRMTALPSESRSRPSCRLPRRDAVIPAVPTNAEYAASVRPMIARPTNAKTLDQVGLFIIRGIQAGARAAADPRTGSPVHEDRRSAGATRATGAHIPRAGHIFRSPLRAEPARVREEAREREERREYDEARDEARLVFRGDRE